MTFDREEEGRTEPLNPTNEETSDVTKPLPSTAKRELPKARPNIWKKAAKVVLMMVVGALIFVAGVRVGELRAWFSYRWAESYSENFGDAPQDMQPAAGVRPNMPPRFFNGHGIFGQVMRVDGNRIYVKDRDGGEKLIVISSQTTIRKGSQDIMPRDVHPDQGIIVIGTPNPHGQIEANLIRLFPINGGVIPPDFYHSGFHGVIVIQKGANL